MSFITVCTCVQIPPEKHHKPRGGHKRANVTPVTLKKQTLIYKVASFSFLKDRICNTGIMFFYACIIFYITSLHLPSTILKSLDSPHVFDTVCVHDACKWHLYSHSNHQPNTTTGLKCQHSLNVF